MITRDQERARHAYACVAEVKSGERDDYDIAVRSLGAFVMRNGLAASMAWLERDKSKRAVEALRGHLAAAGIAGLEKAAGDDIARQVRGLDARDYMLATRDVLKVITWFRRAVQATAGGGD